MMGKWPRSNSQPPPPRRPSATQYHSPPENDERGRRGWVGSGPLRVVLFCGLAVLLPCALVSVALLMRFVVHGSSLYHLSPSDMRILDQRISTIWCQSERVVGNTSFTVYVTEGDPAVVASSPSSQVLISRKLVVPDEVKEYWGFYLLQGSSFKIQTCARWKGGTLLIVRGRAHLEYCAYMGEADSAAGDSDEFSNSDSGERGRGVRPPVGAPTTTAHHHYNSKEEISLILSKIRQYIRSRPKNYSKLKKSLAEWMLIEGGNRSIGSGEVSSRSSPPSTNSSSFLETPTVQTLLDGLRMEEGSVLRHRRQTQRRKHSASGEDGAFEVEDRSAENVIEDGKEGKGSTGGRKSIWEAGGIEEGTLNGTTGVDGSDSESESSWSSSEEAMAKCEGVVAFFNILPNDSCGLGTERDDDDGLFPYYEGQVNVSGYYYFIFGSENEKRDNLIRAKFQLDKFVYDLPQSLPNCTGVRDCRVQFQFASSQKLVVTVPQPPPNLESGMWDEVYVLQTECEPRTSLYLIFVLTVPLVILLCAFQ